MMKNSIAPADVIAVLNRALVEDRAAISQMFTTYTQCNPTLVNDPTIQCSMLEQQARVRPLGIINGLFGIFDDGPKKGFGAIYMTVNEDGSIKEFSLVDNLKYS
jgi:hypothetical protein